MEDDPQLLFEQGEAQSATIRHDLYPYAAGGVVTYMRAGRPFWDGQKTRGGWMHAPELAPGQETLRTALTDAGLAETAPHGGSGSRWPVLAWTSTARQKTTLAERPNTPTPNSSTKTTRRELIDALDW